MCHVLSSEVPAEFGDHCTPVSSPQRVSSLPLFESKRKTHWSAVLCAFLHVVFIANCSIDLMDKANVHNFIFFLWALLVQQTVLGFNTIRDLQNIPVHKICEYCFGNVHRQHSSAGLCYCKSLKEKIGKLWCAHDHRIPQRLLGRVFPNCSCCPSHPRSGKQSSLQSKAGGPWLPRAQPGGQSVQSGSAHSLTLSTPTFQLPAQRLNRFCSLYFGARNWNFPPSLHWLPHIFWQRVWSL